MGVIVSESKLLKTAHQQEFKITQFCFMLKAKCVVKRLHYVYGHHALPPSDSVVCVMVLLVITIITHPLDTYVQGRVGKDAKAIATDMGKLQPLKHHKKNIVYKSKPLQTNFGTLAS